MLLSDLFPGKNRHFYLASPYTSSEQHIMELRYHGVVEAVVFLNENYPLCFFYSPIAYYHPIAVKHDLPRDAAYWRARNIAEMNAADALILVTLPGFKQSTGVAFELGYATATKKTIVCYNPKLMEIEAYDSNSFV